MELQILTANDFDALYALLEQSFPSEEYRDFDKQKALFQNEKYAAYGILDEESKQLKALVSLWNFESFVYIEHFAVNATYRNQGLGAKILSSLKEKFTCQLCLEVELPETEMAKRRIAFYERNGFSYNTYPYVQPPYSLEKSSVPLRFMTTNGTISQEQFELIKTSLYKEVYNVK